MTKKFNDLNITVAMGLCARINDETAKNIILSAWGENGGKYVLASKLSAVTDVGSKFKGTAVVNIDWLRYFRGLTTGASMFQNCTSIVSADLRKCLPNGVTDINHMFTSCTGLTSLDCSNWDVRNVTRIDGLFVNCSSLETLDTTGWNFTKLNTISTYSEQWKGPDGLFQNCSKLKSLDINDWDVSKVSNFSALFSGCSALTSLDLSRWNTSSCAKDRIYRTFDRCSSLISLNVNGWDVRNAIGFVWFFSNCSSLKELDLSSWKTSNIEDMYGCFAGCSSLETLNLSGWSFSDSGFSLGWTFNGVQSLKKLILNGCSDKAVDNFKNNVAGNPKIYQDAHVWVRSGNSWIDEAAK